MDRGIHKSLGTLEEQLEKLEGLFDQIDFTSEEVMSDHATPILDELRLALENASGIRTSIEENLLWEKCFPLSTILERLNSFLISESRNANIEISIAWTESGKIPLSVAQGLMPSILSLLRIVVDRLANEEVVSRKRSFRLGTKAIVLQLSGGSDFFSLKVMDDSFNHKSDLLKYKRDFQKIRSKVARHQGFCSFLNRDPYGFEFEMKVPMPRSRVSALILDTKNGRYAVPMISVFDVVRSVPPDQIHLHENGVHYLRYKEMEVPICEINNDTGICTAERDFASDFNKGCCLILGAADFNLAIYLRDLPREQLVRTESAADYLDKNSWHRELALFVDQGKPIIAPFLGGDVIVEFQKTLQVKI